MYHHETVRFLSRRQIGEDKRSRNAREVKLLANSAFFTVTPRHYHFRLISLTVDKRTFIMRLDRGFLKQGSRLPRESPRLLEFARCPRDSGILNSQIPLRDHRSFFAASAAAFEFANSHRESPLIIQRQGWKRVFPRACTCQI